MDSDDRDPFVDPRDSQTTRGRATASTLLVNRDVSLSLGVDSLIVIGMKCLIFVQYEHLTEY